MGVTQSSVPFRWTARARKKHTVRGASDAFVVIACIVGESSDQVR